MRESVRESLITQAVSRSIKLGVKLRIISRRKHKPQRHDDFYCMTYLFKQVTKTHLARLI